MESSQTWVTNMTKPINYLASVDLTTLFKSCVKTIKTRNKAIGVSFPLSKIFSKAPSSQLYNRAKDILDNIYSHDNLLCEHRKKYIVDNANSLSDMEKSYMDKVISKNLKFIEENIRTLEADIKDVTEKQCPEHCRECYLGIINILRSKYLKTNASFRDMKDLRMRKRKEREQLFKLQRPNGLTKKTFTEVEKIKPISRNKTKEYNRWNQSKDGHEGKQCNDDQLFNSKIKDENDCSLDSQSKSFNSSYLDEEVDVVLSGLSEDDKQLLEQENDHLYQELMSNQEEVKHITRQVVELSRMQDMLTENVEIQAQQIEEIHETILHSTDSVQRGNEEVREAMRKDAGFRVWIMFFLIVMSFTLLFLDWYSP